MRAPQRVRAAGNPVETSRHMDVYPSRRADIRKHRMTALNKLIACGDRFRSTGAFLD